MARVSSAVNTPPASLDPPPPYDLSYDTLTWELVDGVQQTVIPTSWVDTFVSGEEQRNNGTNFIRYTSTRKTPKRSGSYNKTVWWCQRGPENNATREVREAAAAAVAAKRKLAVDGGEDELKPRASRTAKGLSIKVGCKCHFAVQVYDSDPRHATIRYNTLDHCGHENRYAPYISDETALWVRLMVLASEGKISSSDLKRINEDRYLNPIMCARHACVLPAC